LFPLHRLQDLIGAIEGVFARVPYLIEHLLWGIVALEVREHLVLTGGEVHVGHKLLELAEVEVAKVAYIAKTHVVVPPVSLCGYISVLPTMPEAQKLKG
jgi:hypothetical protein